MERVSFTCIFHVLVLLRCERVLRRSLAKPEDAAEIPTKIAHWALGLREIGQFLGCQEEGTLGSVRGPGCLVLRKDSL